MRTPNDILHSDIAAGISSSDKILISDHLHQHKKKKKTTVIDDSEAGELTDAGYSSGWMTCPEDQGGD